jgi:hypothetical protein
MDMGCGARGRWNEIIGDLRANRLSTKPGAAFCGHEFCSYDAHSASMSPDSLATAGSSGQRLKCPRRELSASASVLR